MSKPPPSFRAIAALATLALAGCSSKVSVPSSYTAFTPKDGAFSVQQPAGWDVETGSRPDNTYSWAKFSEGPAMVHVIADVSGSLMADASRAMGGDLGDQDAEYPVLMAHETKKRNIEDEFSGYEEGKTVVVDTKLGKGALCEFEADGSFGARLRGYRATMLSRDRRITVLTYCPKKQWLALKPAFDQVLLSVGRG